MKCTRTDLAYEQIELSLDETSYSHTKKTYDNIIIHDIKILKQNEFIDSNIGAYITIEFDHLNDEENREKVREALFDSLKELMGKHRMKIKKVLIVGLGNQDIIADALGPRVAKECVVTAHLYALKQKELIKGTSNVTVIVPGVMGQTGIESAKYVEAIALEIKPDCVIVIDALATNALKRINRVIQLSDTGIKPGAGVGNQRLAIDQETLQIPVFSIGVATVVSIEAVIKQVLSSDETLDVKKIMKHADLNEFLSMVVTPKEMDEEITHLSKVISNAINFSLHSRFSKF